MPLKNVKPIALCDTANMSNEEWLIMRTGKIHNIPCTIGGSEVSAVLDISPFTTSKELYDRKRGIEPKIKKEFNEEAKEIGKIYEPFVQQQFILWFKKNYHVTLKVCNSIEEFNAVENGIYNDKHFYQCGERDEDGNLKYPFAVANVDGLIKYKGRIGVLEYKTTDVDSKKSIGQWKSGKVPRYYDCQVRSYLKVLNLDFAFIVCAWAFKLKDMAAIYIERDYEVENIIYDKMTMFYYAVVEGKEWDVSESDATLLANYYTRLYGEPAKSRLPVRLSPVYFSLLEKMVERTKRRQELKDILDMMDKEDDELVSILSPVAGDASYLYCQKGLETISIDISIPKTKSMCHEIKDYALLKSAHLDYEALKEQCPDVWKKYQTEVFDVKSFKTQERSMFEKYRLPSVPTGETKKFKAEKKIL